MNSLYLDSPTQGVGSLLRLDKRNFFNCNLNIMSSHNKELRQQRIREMEHAAPKIIFENPKVAIGPDKDIDQFAATFLSKKKQNNRRKRRVWNNRYNLRIAYQRIEDWKMHYYVAEITPSERKRKISFCL